MSKAETELPRVWEDPAGFFAEAEPQGRRPDDLTRGCIDYIEQSRAHPPRLRRSPGILRVVDALRTWGYDPDTLFEPLDRVDVPEARQKALAKANKDRWDRYKLQRRALVMIRKNIGTSLLGSLVRKTRFYCNVILRGDGGGFSRYAKRPYGSGAPDDDDPAQELRGG